MFTFLLNIVPPVSYRLDAQATAVEHSKLQYLVISVMRANILCQIISPDMVCARRVFPHT